MWKAVMAAMLAGCGIAVAAPEVIAHRGASRAAPENTLAAFKRGWELGADAVECDLWMTADDRLVCLHDRTTKRTTGVDLDVRKSTLAQLRELDAGSWKDAQWKGERIPTLEELFAIVPDGRKVFVEIKGGPALVPVLRDVVEKSRLKREQIVIISFNREAVRLFKQALPDVKAYLLFDFKRDKETGEWKPSLAEVMAGMMETNADGVDLPPYGVLTERFVRNVHEAGRTLHVWTINDTDVATRCWQLGVDSITTDIPDVIKELVGQLEEKK